MQYFRLSPLDLLPLASVLLLWIASPGYVGWWFLTPLALVPLFLFLQKSDSATSKKLFTTGLLFGTLLSILLMYWIVRVLAHFGGLPLPLAGGALLLLAFYMGIYPALFCMISQKILKKHSSLLSLFLLPTCWVAFDWIRSFAFTGFPWLDIGYFFAFQPQLIQFADIFGHYGITWLIIFINVLIIFLLSSLQTKKEKIILFIVASALLLPTFFYSISAWHNWQNPLGKQTHIAIVQGNIAQEKKWSKEIAEQTLFRYLQQTEKRIQEAGQDNDPIALNVALTVWPETAIPFYANANPLTKHIVQSVRQSNSAILSGSPWFERIGEKYRLYNAAVLFAPPAGEISDQYYKSHLVPFGEYVPLQDFLFFLAPLVESAGNFSAGTIEAPLSLTIEQGNIMEIGVLLCYESIFPAVSRKWSEKGANILVNLTNDAWYGRTSAPWHSLAMTVLRAVENRRAVIRSANTGFSGGITPAGIVQHRSMLFTQTEFSVYPYLITEKSLYTQYGWLFAPLCAVIMIGYVFLLEYQRRRRTV